MKKLLIILLFLFLAPPVLEILSQPEAFADQVDTAWVRRYSASVAQSDFANAIALDLSGNVHVTGQSYDLSGAEDYATIKYYPNGDTAWLRRYNGPVNGVDGADAMAVDGSGNVYVTGWSVGSGTIYDYATIKYYPNGDIAWARRYNGPGNSFDDANAIVVDGSGNVYVTGSSVGSGTIYDYATIKYYPNGDTGWVRRYNGPGNNNDYARAIAVDGSGNVYVTGNSVGSGTLNDYATIKYYPNGNTGWVRRYNGPGNDDDLAFAMAVDGSGNVCVTGYSVGSGTSGDCATIKYDQNGNELWIRRYNGPQNHFDVGRAIAVEGSGNVYVTGYSEGSGPYYDYATIKYYPNGDTGWVRTYNGTGNNWDEACAIALDVSGNVYVTGKSVGSGTSYDYATIKYYPNGDTGWVIRYNGPGNGGDEASAIAVDGSGNVYVTGESDGGATTGTDYATIKYVQYPAPQIRATSPAQNALNVPPSTNLSVTFDTTMDASTINDSTFVVNARSTGLHQGTISYDSLTRTATFNPSGDFDAGEVVAVVLTTDIKSSAGIRMGKSYVWSFTTVVGSSDGIFPSQTIYPVGDGPHDIIAADLDGDGDLDLAIANENSNYVSVLFNNGDATFTLDSVYSVGNKPLRVFAADLDQDGDLDLVTPNYLSNNVSVLLNHGDGTFAPQSLYPVGTNPRSVFAGDLNGDGHLDLAVPNEFSNNVTVLLNNGDATFAPQSVFVVGQNPYFLYATDLDQDGDLDLVTANFASNNVSVLLNHGDGTFAPHSTYSVGSGPHNVFGADLDSDGDVDLATANSLSNNVSVLLNKGNGIFAPHSDFPVGNTPKSVFAADLDGDGDIDLTNANADVDNISVLLNNGNGSFGSFSVYPVGDYPYSVFAADLDGDGDLDLVTANRNSDNISVLLNFLRGDANGDGVINVTDVVYLINYLFLVPPGPAPIPPEAGDANCDGIINITDVVYLINYLFLVPPGPPPGC